MSTSFVRARQKLCKGGFDFFPTGKLVGDDVPGILNKSEGTLQWGEGRELARGPCARMDDSRGAE